MALSPQGQTLAQGPATESWAKSSRVALKMGETWELLSEQTELNPEDICCFWGLFQGGEVGPAGWPEAEPLLSPAGYSF